MVFFGFLALGAAFTLALCAFARPLGERLNVIDYPSREGRKTHAQPTPAVGGVILTLAGSCLFLIALPWTDSPTTKVAFARYAAFGIVLLAMLIGFLDDRRHIPATWRLFLGLALSALLLVLIPDLALKRIVLPSANLVLETGSMAVPLTMICLLALKNAVNMADGRNGLLLGMSLIWTLFFMTHSAPETIPGLYGLVGILMVLLVFNLRGRLFMGDCGAYGLATYFGIVALALHRNGTGSVRTAEVVLLFLIPALDTLRLIITRLRAGRSPMAPDNQHLHHLLDEAMGWKLGWIVYMSLMAVPIVLYQFIAQAGIEIITGTALAYGLIVIGTQKQRFDQASSGGLPEGVR